MWKLTLALAVALASTARAQVAYTITLENPEQHLLLVDVRLPAGAAQRTLQLPVWNALYQIRDFSQNLRWIKALDPKGQALPMTSQEKSAWQISGAASGATIEYEIYANLAGPFGAELNQQHAFLNLAEVLVYSIDTRNSSVTLTFSGVPAGWRIATALAPAAASGFTAPNYDALVDAPVEISDFHEQTFQQNGATYRIVVDAPASAYDAAKLEDAVRKITATAVEWMQDQPFQHFLFIFHFPESVGAGGGMEHACSAAITLNREQVQADPRLLDDFIAHEFFHLWNVKRIRPASLEPVDYTQENYTRALWFSEGVTRAVTELLLLRARLESESTFLDDLGSEIRTLQMRPAHLRQSAEESSLNAWLEKYPEYRSPERSVSYYNKGELLGFLLDLEVRRATNDHRSLRDVFQWMDRNYAQQGKFFEDSKGVRKAAEAVSGADLRDFFRRYVAGVDELPYNDLLAYVGLRVTQRREQVALPGFDYVENPGQLPAISAVDAASDAAQQGLAPGDLILKINGKRAQSGLQRIFAGLKPGAQARIRIRDDKGEREVTITLGARDEERVSISDVAQLTAGQRAHRAAWLRGEDEP